MANIYQVVDKVTREALEIAHEKATFIGTCDLQHDASFDGTSGNTLRIRLPDKFTTRKNSWTMAVQDQSEQVVTLTHGTVYGCDMDFKHDEIMFALSGDRAWEEITRRKIEPAIAGMISTIESDILQARMKDVYQMVGTPGVVVGASGDTSAIGLARAKLNQQACPMDDRYVQMDSVTMATIVNGQKGIFNPQAQVGRAYLEGYYGRGYGADWYENERVYAHTNGDDVAWAVDDAAALAAYTEAAGLSVLNMDTMGATVADGSVFTIADLYDVHPETKTPYAHLKQFTVISHGAVAGNQSSITFSPTIRIGGPLQNTYLASGVIADLEDNTVTLVGNATTRYQHNLMYQKGAFAIVNAAPPIVDSAEKCMVKRKENLAFRVWLGSDIVNSRLLLRLDTVFGSLTQRPEFACRITN